MPSLVGTKVNVYQLGSTELMPGLPPTMAVMILVHWPLLAVSESRVDFVSENSCG